VKVYPDTPTFKDLGVDMDLGNFRSIFGPPKMDPDAAKALTEAFAKAVKDDKYKKYLEDSSASMNYLDGEGTKKAYSELEKIMRPILVK
jgi:putative tricarboxylic transport membrane protein